MSFKLIILPRTRIGLDRAGLRHHLETVHGPLAMATPDASRYFTGYTHHYAHHYALGPDDPLFAAPLSDRDALTIIRFAQPDDLKASTNSAGYREVLSPDEDNFREREGSFAFAAQEHVLRTAMGAPAKLFVMRRCAGDPGDVAGQWAERVAAVLAQGAEGIGGYCINILTPLGPPAAFDMLDEIELTGTAIPPAHRATLIAASDGLFAGPATAMLTEPRCFL